MTEKLFIYKINNSNSRDSVKYISEDVGSFELGHYFSSIDLEGSCFSGGFDIDEVDFDNITTILNEDDFEKLKKIRKEMSLLGYSIDVGDERYLMGMELLKELKPIIDKLQSRENLELFEQVVNEEIDILKDEFLLTDNQVEDIFENYPLEYRDRSIVGMVYDSVEEVGEEYAYSTGLLHGVDEFIKGFFDYEGLGQDLVDRNETYLMLDDGRIVYYMM